MKLNPIALLLLAGLCPALSAQTLFHVRNGCGVDDIEMDQTHYVFDPSSEATQIIKTIMESNFLEPNFVIKSGDVENALATVEGGNRYIIYNTTYVERIKRSGGSDWAAFFVFAHEIGHHLSNHRFDLTDEARMKEQELKADIYAGGMLFRLGASLDDAQNGASPVFKEYGGRAHPPRRARLEAIASGWKKAKDLSGGARPVNVGFGTDDNKSDVIDYPTGERFTGTVKDGKPHHGTFTFPSGEKYVGDFRNEKRNGQGIYYFPNGNRFEGSFLDDQYETGTFYYSSGDRYTGQFSNYKMHGLGIYYFLNGRRYEGTFINDKYASGTFYYPDGDKYTGQFSNDKRNGQGTYYYKDGRIESGLWIDDTFIK